jgi:putative spermidine/putrescine transport system ATP-binding protein
VTVSHPNTDTSIDAALERRDQRVVLSWRREHLVSLGTPGSPSLESPEEETA